MYKLFIIFYVCKKIIGSSVPPHIDELLDLNEVTVSPGIIESGEKVEIVVTFEYFSYGSYT